MQQFLFVTTNHSLQQNNDACRVWEIIWFTSTGNNSKNPSKMLHIQLNLNWLQQVVGQYQITMLGRQDCQEPSVATGQPLSVSGNKSII